MARMAVIDFAPDNDNHGVRAPDLIEAMVETGFELVQRVDRWAGKRFLLLFRKPAGVLAKAEPEAAPLGE